ncbi:SMI1/KNR4 family protein [Streptomyces sp. CSDS2]|uniref:SMI1/KNR4 family protein n=1 Tax=Streptomyces sp. CSDS2 TaxID=3055051 RepID=UPI0025AFC08F|nr:SMI1/KNR4 family protein [Streptomyces sp. CSDS2]MDN3259194.1 SMI1/KNR4 family protein [Streptomyces sp. CSDS2]
MTEETAETAAIAARQVTDAWRRIEAWLGEHAPVSHAALGPGAGAEEIAAVEAALGFAVPVELRTLWGLVSGGNVNGGGFWLGNRSLLRLDDVVAVYRRMMVLQTQAERRYPTPGVPGEDDIVVWQRPWIPVFSCGEHDTVLGTYLDSGSGLMWHWSKYAYVLPDGTEPQHSVVTCLEEIADSLETPALATEGTAGLLDGRLVWLDESLTEDERRRWHPAT